MYLGSRTLRGAGLRFTGSLRSLGLLLSLGLSGGCAARRVEALTQENLRLQLELQQTQAQLAEAQRSCPPVAPAAAPLSALEEEAAGKAMNEAAQLERELRFIEAREVYQRVLDTWPTSRAASSALRRFRELQMVGEPAPPMGVVRWLQGEAPPDSEVQVLVFWEQWCPHCRDGLPRLSALAPAWAEQGVQIIGLTRLSKRSTEELVAEFYAEYRIGFPTALTGDAVNAAYAVTGVPAAAVVRDGVVIWRGHPDRLTDGLLERLIAQGGGQE